MARPRDSQVRKFQAAWRSMDNVGEVLGDEFAAEQFAQTVVESRWWKTQCPRIKDVEVITRKNAYIYIPKPDSHGLAELVMNEQKTYTQGDVLFRLCQALNSQEDAWHGPQYAKILVKAVARFCGEAEGQRLRAAFKEHKVKSRVVSDAAREAARERWHQRQTSPENQAKAADELKNMLAELKN